jgi:hypothetical protein
VELGEEQITVRHGDRWLALQRNRSQVNWRREDGNSGALELTEAGTLRSSDHEQEMDMAAEAWARELMQESQR